MFPTTIYVHVAQVADAQRDAFDSSLCLVSGHLHVAAWYLACFSAFEAADMGRLAALWQCALTVTMHLRAGMQERDLAVLSIQVSERAKTGARLASDSFVAFAFKALLVLRGQAATSRMKCLNDAGVRFNGAAVS